MAFGTPETQFTSCCRNKQRCRYAKVNSDRRSHGGPCIWKISSSFHLSLYTSSLIWSLMTGLVENIKAAHVTSPSCTLTATRTCVNTNGVPGQTASGSRALTQHSGGTSGCSGSCVISARVVFSLNDCRQRGGWMETQVCVDTSLAKNWKWDPSHSEMTNWCILMDMEEEVLFEIDIFSRNRSFLALHFYFTTVTLILWSPKLFEAPNSLYINRPLETTLLIILKSVTFDQNLPFVLHLTAPLHCCPPYIEQLSLSVVCTRLYVQYTFIFNFYFVFQGVHFIFCCSLKNRRNCFLILCMSWISGEPTIKKKINK